MESNVISNLKTGRLFDKQAFWHLAILVLIGAAIGVYLIATTVIISKDGVFYIQRAQRFAHDPVEVVKQHPPGLPIMIYGAHKMAGVFFDGESVYTWIYSAQAATVLCRLLAIAGLYLLGKLLVGGRDSFLAMLVLLILPYPAHMSTEVIREWPHLMFLAWGYFVLLYAARKGSWWLFGIAGMLAGLGHIVRPEALQILLFAGIWLMIRFLRPLAGFGRKKTVLSMLAMAAGLMVVALLYGDVRGRFLPDRLKNTITNNSNLKHPNYQNSGAEFVKDQGFCKAGFEGGKFFEGLGKLFERISQNLMYFFMLPVAIGFYLRFRKGGGAEGIERVAVLGIAILYFTMMVLLYSMSDYMSGRHC